MKDRQIWRGPIRRIQDRVCATFDVTHVALISRRRDYQIIPPRHICFLLCRTLILNASLPTIGMMFGDRDHTTVISGIKNAKRLMKEDPSLQNKFNIIADDWTKGKF